MRTALLVCSLVMACGGEAGQGPAPADGGADTAADDADAHMPLPRGFGYRGAWRWTAVTTMPPVEFGGGRGVGLVFDTDPPQADVVRFSVANVDRCNLRFRQDGARFTITPGQSCTPPDSAPFSGLRATAREGSFQMTDGALSGRVVWDLAGTRSTLNPPSMTDFTARATLEFGPLAGSSLR